MSIKDGNIASAVEVNKVFLKASICSLANFHKGLTTDNDLFNKSTGYEFSLSGDDYVVDGFGDEDFYDGTNSTCIVGNDQVININYDKSRYVENFAYNCKILDRFDDSSIDTGIWSTTGTVTESSGALNISTNSSAISDGASGLDLKSFSEDTEVIITLVRLGISAANSTGKIQISNGGVHVDMSSRQTTGSPPDSWQDVIRIKIDYSAEEAFVSLNGGAFGGAIDISSVTTNWYIRFLNTTVASSTMSSKIYNVGYLDGAGGTIDYVSTVKTMKDTKTDSILTWDYTGTDSDITGYVSANSGSAYTAATKNIWTTIGTSGTGAKVKLTMTLPSTIDATDSDSYIEQLKAVGAYFD